MAPITEFDTTGFPVTFAAEVKNFDPLNFVRQEGSAQDGALHPFCLCGNAGGDGAVWPEDHAGDRRTRGRVYRFGIGGFEIIEREHTNLLNGGPRKISPFFIPAVIVNMAAGQIAFVMGRRDRFLRRPRRAQRAPIRLATRCG